MTADSDAGPNSRSRPNSRLLRAGGFVSGILLITPMIGVGVATIVDAMLGLAGAQALAYTVKLDAVAITITDGVVAGAISFLSAISVSGTSIYGAEWLRTDGSVEFAFKAGGLAIGTIAGMAIVAAIFWEGLWDGLEKDAPIGTVVSVLGLLAVGWIASRSVTSFLAGRRNPE